MKMKFLGVVLAAMILAPGVVGADPGNPVTKGVTSVFVEKTASVSGDWIYSFTVHNNSLNDSYNAWDVLVGGFSVIAVSPKIGGTDQQPDYPDPIGRSAPDGWQVQGPNWQNDRIVWSLTGDAYSNAGAGAPGKNTGKFTLTYASDYNVNKFIFEAHVYSVNPAPVPVPNGYAYTPYTGSLPVQAGVYGATAVVNSYTWFDTPNVVPEPCTILAGLSILAPAGFVFRRRN